MKSEIKQAKGQILGFLYELQEINSVTGSRKEAASEMAHHKTPEDYTRVQISASPIYFKSFLKLSNNGSKGTKN